ncbi:MAG: hypothetical protein BWY13_01149 [Euryarchaeota archaeon ADurb.Bin190]|jgi:hypothetical protein|nr:hypothetical protein [Methanothrix sp.]OQB20940.1 MAG: hypothetical protein BWY13_01149 [Euryarchaeota archaeon ADurb.Bin190]HNQ55329.1 hypothetical protein [Methanothrix sp.]HNU40499.1 hypothetical protein [Methanothrix sp.]HPH48724.1 hypothetical protein [Methanothrix sp.]
MTADPGAEALRKIAGTEEPLDQAKADTGKAREVRFLAKATMKIAGQQSLFCKDINRHFRAYELQLREV